MDRVVDFNDLKARTLNSGIDEEAVTVNTRALIDKVLARYSGEWTVLRELLQNASDASATRVTIKFETLPSSTVPLPNPATPSSQLKHVVSNHTLKRLVISNNGAAFTENDWSRLKRIAEGNPDETKIGAFGVGFYSVFADCEEPFVSSGNEAMAFYWKGNSLFTRRLQLPSAETSSNTTFVLDYRNSTSPVPSLLPLAQFLASSLTFVGIESLELWLDSWNIVTLSKNTVRSRDVFIPKGIEPKTSEGMMKIMKVVREVAQIHGQWMNIVGWRPPTSAESRFENSRGNEIAPSLRNFFSRLAGSSTSMAREDSTVQRPNKAEQETATEDVTTISSTTVSLHINTATIRTSTTAAFNQELERATKKPPPKTTKLAILTSPLDADSLQPLAGPLSADIFATVLPRKNGRIFIGFPTHQTTGLSAHISAPSVIPTVERESIDLNARWVRTWNFEMLRAAGIVCRIAWSSEMTMLKDSLKSLLEKSGKSKIRLEVVNQVLPEAISASQHFSFRESTPSAKTGETIEDAFWRASTSLDVLSTCGVLPSHEVRIAPKELSFMECIPALPEQLVLEAKPFVEKLIDFGLVTEVTVSDIKKALETSALNSKQVVEFLDWIGKQFSKDKLDQTTIRNLLSVAVAHDEEVDGTPSSVLVLGTMNSFVNPSRIPVDLPLPPTVMPFKFTRSLSKAGLEALGWQELQIVPWLRWLLEKAGDRNILTADQDMTQSPKFATQILQLLSKQWESISQSSRSTVIELLGAQTIIPTKLGMRRPPDAYFPSVKLFEDLATFTGLNGVKDKVLLALGVRKTIELGVVFSRLGTSSTSITNERTRWSHVDLIQYLASVQADIPTADMQRLRNTPICPKELGQNQGGVSQELYKVSELFEPRPVLRELGLPLLGWHGMYRGNSPEGRFLSVLGLRRDPNVTELISIMATSASTGDISLRDRAMTYFLANHHINGYASFDYSKVTTPFLPTNGNLSTPSNCFADESASLLGFSVLKRDLQPHATRFGVRTHPPIDDCVKILLRSPPSTKRDARAIFGYFAGRLSEINSSNIPLLSSANFVPVLPEPSPTSKHESIFPVRHISPMNCFLGESDTYGDIFNFVDFGQEANAFLLKCGSKHEPTKLEVAQILVKEPARISATFRSPEKYLNLLRSLAESVSTLRKNKELFKDMKRAPFLLASKEVSTTSAMTKKSAQSQVDEIDDLEEEESQGIREWQLTSAQDAIIIDDYTSYNLFKTNILAAPQEETLEDFYFQLGAPLLSSLVEEAARHGQKATDQSSAAELQKQIYERSRLFLHEQPPDMIKHDAKWLEKNLKVVTVSAINLRRSLKGRNVSHVEKRSAVVTQVNREYTLWITGSATDLYQVSQALVHLLLTRPKLHSALTLEMLLKTNLFDLRARGFNVNRILRQKAAEARMADSLRQQELEEEKKKIEEQEKVWKQSQDQTAKERAQKPSGLPGGFPDSPDRKPTRGITNGDEAAGSDNENQTRHIPRGLFSNITKQLGLGDGRAGRQLQSFLGNQPQQSSQPQAAITNGEEPPPPYFQDGAGSKRTVDQQPVTAPHQLHENLLSAIKRTREHNSSGVFSRGETNQVTETTSYCDERPAHDLTSVAVGAHEMQIFLSPSTTSDASAFLEQNSTGLMLFASLLKEVGSMFAMSPKTINIFYEPRGKTIGFNSSGSIFCNYLYFQQLHEKKMMQTTGDRTDAFVYWWVILCHELAHNLVADHSSNHSYYTEGFVMQYFGKVMAKLVEFGGQAPS